MLIDSTVLDTDNKDTSLVLLKLQNMITQAMDLRTVKTYTAWADIGVSGTPSALELYKALPNGSHAVLPLVSGNGVTGVKPFNTPTSIYTPGILELIKSDNGRLAMVMHSEHFTTNRMVYSSGVNDSGWGRLIPAWTTIPVPTDLTNLNQILYDGEYYIPSSVAANISGHPYAGDQILQRRSSSFGGSQQYYYIQGAAASNILLYKSPLATSWKTL